MKIADMEIGAKSWTPLAIEVLAVLSRRVDGWCVYVGAVPGDNHELEMRLVSETGAKQSEPMARAIVTHLFGFDPGDLPYARAR